MSDGSEPPAGGPGGVRLWQVCCGLSALLGLLCAYGGVISIGRSSDPTAAALCLTGAGVIFALLGTGLRGRER